MIRECNILDIFNNIIYTTDNPSIIKTENVFKDGDKIKRIVTTDQFDLTSNNLITELRKSKIETIKFKQRGVLRLFRKYNKSVLDTILSNLSDIDWIITNSELKKLLNLDSIVDDRLSDNEIIIGSKLSRCILNKETGEYYIDKDSIIVLFLI